MTVQVLLQHANKESDTMPSHRKCLKTTENKGFLPPPKTMGQSVAVKPPVAFQKTNKINTFAQVSYGMALNRIRFTILNGQQPVR